jgi:hypothetical protein
MRIYRILLLVIMAVLAMTFLGSANAADVMRTKIIGPYGVELHVLPAEPFFSKEDVAAKQVKDGMEIEGGAVPVLIDAATHPNHHLVVHVFDRKTHQALTDATVTMKFAPLGKGDTAGASIEVPVVVMQAIGKGPQSTHYGNNISMPAGSYKVTVTVNGQPADFNVTASDARSKPMGHMDHMKM